MNFLGKFIDVLSGGNTAEDEEYEMEQLEEIDNTSESKDRSRKIRVLRDDEEVKGKKITNLFSGMNRQNNSTSQSSKVIITQPNHYEETTEIVDYLKMKKSVIVNLEFANKEDAKKIVDFLSGAAYGVDGSIQKISNYIFFIAPSNVEIHNEMGKDDFKNKLTFSWLKQQ